MTATTTTRQHRRSLKRRTARRTDMSVMLHFSDEDAQRMEEVLDFLVALTFPEGDVQDIESSDDPRSRLGLTPLLARNTWRDHLYEHVGWAKFRVLHDRIQEKPDTSLEEVRKLVLR